MTYAKAAARRLKPFAKGIVRHNTIERWRISRTGFWFVDIPRTGSSSLRSELGEHYSRLHGKLNYSEFSEISQRPKLALKSKEIVPSHSTALQMRDYFGAQKWDSLYTFSFVRNPWSRALSYYHYLCKAGHSKEVRLWSFEEYLRQIASLRESGEPPKALKYKPNVMTASDFLVDDTGNLIVEQVFRFEDRTAAMKQLRKRLGLKDLGKRHVMAATPRGIRYVDAFNATSKALVAEIYSEDCLRFGYEFGDS